MQSMETGSELKIFLVCDGVDIAKKTISVI